MSQIDLIKKLRQDTGAGLLDVKNALSEAGDDPEKALEILRKSGALKAQKKSARPTSEGLIALKVSDDHKKGSLIQINCETDFVAKNEIFINFVSELSNINFKTGQAENEFNSKKEDLILKIGENITFTRAEVLEGAYVSNYLHTNKKVGALVSFTSELDEETAHNIAMHVTALNPNYLKPEDVPTEVLEKEKEIYRVQLKAEGKPDEIIEKILPGKLAKFFEETCLLKQPFIKDDKKKVEQLLPKDIEVVKFIRYSL